jgi:dihydrofolate synthase/folylpolyglutamate synthase
MKLQQILSNLQKLHPKEIDLSLDRIKKLCKKLGNPQDNLKYISVVGTNGKYSTIQAIRAILKDANINCNIYTSPHIQKINERFIYNNEEISDENLIKLLTEVEDINAGEPITYFEILTAAYFYNAKNFKNNINIIESGLFHRADACSIIKSNLASIITAIGLDHLDWLPKNEQTIDQIIFEKTSSLLTSKVIVSKQSSNEILNKIENSIKENYSKKIVFGKDFNYSLNENGFFYYEDKYGGLKLPLPNLEGEFQLSNASTAIATIRNIEEINISDQNIKNGIKKIKSIARFSEIKNGKLKDLVKKNKIYIDGSHNPLGASVLNKHLNSLECNKHIILGMMSNKNHLEYINYFKDKISSLTTVDIPNQPNAINGEDLMKKLKKLKKFKNINYKKSIKEAIKSIDLKDNDIIIITGSLYLAGGVLNLN